MKNFKKTKQFLFRLFLAGIFLILYAVTASAVPISAQGGISDKQSKASALLIKWDAYQGLDEAELSSGVWLFCGRAELGALPGETYYDGALYVETLGERSDYFVLTGDSLAWTGYSQGRSLGMLPDKPFSLRPLKVAYNDTKIPVTNYIKTYSSKGLLNVRYRLSARGETCFQSIRQGKGLVMAGDTIDNIVLTRHTDDYIIRSEETGDADTASRIVYCASNPIRYTDPTGCEWLQTKDAKKQTSGYQWVEGKDARDKNGKLLPGVYEAAILFTAEGDDGMKFDSSSDYNMGSSTAIVYGKDGPDDITKFDACTYPSDTKAYPTIPAGDYEAKTGLHHGSYKALRVGDKGTKDFDKNEIELGKQNPSKESKTTKAVGINIHKSGKSNKTGMTKDGKPISAGCLLIDRNNWSDFIKLFPDNTTIGVTIKR